MAVLGAQRFSGIPGRKSIDNKVSNLSSIANGNRHSEIHVVVAGVWAEHEVYYQGVIWHIYVTDNSISPWVRARCGYSTAEWLIKIQTNDFLCHNGLPLHGLIFGIVLLYELHKISVREQHKQSTGALQANAYMKDDGHGTLHIPG